MSSPKQTYEDIKLQAYYNPDEVPEKVKIAGIRFDPFSIRFLSNPSEALKRLAVEQDGLAIQFIRYPCEEVQRAAVNQDKDAYEYIVDPTDEITELYTFKMLMSEG